MNPQLGDVVLWILTPELAPHYVGSAAPATVVRVWHDGRLNLKVHLDGPGEHWEPFVREGGEPGTWHWPPGKG